METFGAKLSYNPEDAKKLRILIVTPCMHVPDGVSITLLKLIAHIKKVGAKVKIFTSDVAKEVLEKKEDIDINDYIFGKCFHLHYDPTDNYSIHCMLNKHTKAEINKFDPNVFHYTSPDPAAFSVGEWTRKARKPIIATWHSNIPDYLDHTGIYRYSLATYVPQQAIVDMLKDRGYPNLRVWGRGVNVKLFNPAKRSEALRKEYGISKDQVVVLWVSRCVKEKRHDVFIEVLKRLEAKYPGKTVGLLVGRGDRYKEMEAVKNVIGVGWKNREGVAEVYASSDILLFPSGVETFGNVTLEGMASGLPVLGDKGCSAHLIKDGITGFTCSQEDVVDKETGKVLNSYEQYFNACEKLVLDKNLREKFGKKCREIAVNQYENEKVLDEMIAHYVEAYQLGVDDKVPKIKFGTDQRLMRIIMELIDKIGMPMVGPFAQFAFQWTLFDQASLIVLVVAGLLTIYFNFM